MGPERAIASTTPVSTISRRSPCSACAAYANRHRFGSAKCASIVVRHYKRPAPASIATISLCTCSTAITTISTPARTEGYYTNPFGPRRLGLGTGSSEDLDVG